MTTGRPLDNAKRERILHALSADAHEFFNVGTPPYNVAHLAQTLALDPSNLRKYLLQLEAQGLVVREYRKVSAWNAISKNHMDRKCLCFWNAATQQEDKRLADEWVSQSGARSAGALARFGLS